MQNSFNFKVEGTNCQPDLPPLPSWGFMKTWLLVLVTALILFAMPAQTSAAKLKPETLKAWHTYVQLTEKRIESELSSASGFLAADFMKPAEAEAFAAAMKNGQIHIQKFTPSSDGTAVRVPDGMIHHWIGSVFVPNIKLQTLLSWVQNYDQHHRYFPEVEGSKLLSHDGDKYTVFFRFVRKKVVTVHYNTEHTVIYRRHRDGLESSRSFTTKIAEIEDAGSAKESEKPQGDDSGYMWRLNSYWRFRERDGGVVVECESISLSRSIPFGFGWLVSRFVESVPQESLENTLSSIRDGVRK